MQTAQRSRNRPVKSITFRVYPENKSLYAQVTIWPNKTAMYRNISLGRDYLALCKGTQRIKITGDGKSRKTGLFAELNFYQQRLGIEIISHEFTHAAFCFAERKRMDLNAAIRDHNWKVRKREQAMPHDGPEEQFCYALGRMINQFVARCYDLKLYP